jgi:acyl-CoA synthetase (AMP-forming)/AMP-acid ligase II
MRGNVNSLGDSLTLIAGKFPEKTALINFGGARFTWGEFNSRVNKLTNSLIKLGISKGDKVAYLFYNSNQFSETHYAVAKAGAVGVPLNFRLTGRELSYQIDNADTICIVYGNEFIETINSIKGNLSKVKHFVCDGEGGEGVLNYENLIRGADPKEPDVKVSLDDENLILYTSGTTGVPKGAVLTHRNSLFNGYSMIMDYQLTPDDILQIAPPLYHSASLNAFFVPGVILGAKMVLHKQVIPRDMFQAIQEEKITKTWGPGTMWRMLINDPAVNEYDLSSTSLVVNGAMYMPAHMRKQLLSHFPNAEMGDTYGMTEASPCTTILRPKDALRKPASVGVPLTVCDVKIFNEKGEELPVNETGEIVNRGNFMKGYYNMPEETEAVIKDGWFYTGDLGMKDEEGFIYLVDRKKDMIVSGGENVYSKEVEEVISTHPKVLEVAVIGLPDEKWGEVVTAVVAPMPDEKITEEEIIEYSRKSLAGYKCPKRVKLIDNIPKNPAGKIVKSKLKKLYSS